MISVSVSLSRLAALMTFVLVLFASPNAWAAETSLPPAHDLLADAKRVELTGMPLIVMVSLRGCPHCEVVRRSHLLPLLRDGQTRLPPQIRQIEINGRAAMRDFNGLSITHADFANRYKIKVAPVVMLFDANGEMLAEPLVGAMIPDFYGAYFDAALAEADAKLQRRGGR